MNLSEHVCGVSAQLLAKLSTLEATLHLSCIHSGLSWLLKGPGRFSYLRLWCSVPVHNGIRIRCYTCCVDNRTYKR